MRPRYGNLATGLVAFDDGTYGCYPYAPLGRGYKVDARTLAGFNHARAWTPFLWPASCGVVAVGYLGTGLFLLALVLAWHHYLVVKHLSGRPAAPRIALARWANLQAKKGVGGVLAMAVLLPLLIALYLIVPLGPAYTAVATALILVIPIPYLLMVLVAAWNRTASP